MSEFTVSGRFQVRDGWQRFDKEVDAENEDVAIERVYATVGSQHGLERTQVEIEGVTDA